MPALSITLISFKIPPCFQNKEGGTCFNFGNIPNRISDMLATDIVIIPVRVKTEFINAKLKWEEIDFFWKIALLTKWDTHYNIGLQTVLITIK